ncbi:hypothetical protein KR059_008866, partial [Drosophila kikkawai]
LPKTMPKFIPNQILIFLIGLSAGQRLPPGVNPKRYQPPEQHVHPQQYSYKQESLAQYLQGSEHQMPHHHQHQEDLSQKGITTGNIDLERSHIQEHMPVPIDTSQMADAELQFYYFKMHDSDGNNKLDGCELYKALVHLHGEDDKIQVSLDAKTLSDEELALLIDPILEMDDTSRDGFIDYPEFIKARIK